jgi:uncharacterized protein (TIGR02453 family)
MQTKQPRSHQEAGVTNAGFHGFSAETFAWFAGLEQDNSREYFNATRERYEVDVRSPFTLMLQELSGTFGGTVHVFRQQNDMRFTPTVPYKTRTYGVLEFDAPVRARLYADISTRGLASGTGYTRLAPDQLRRYRDAVVHDQVGAQLETALRSVKEADLQLFAEGLTAVPRGYPRDHPRAELLKVRALLVARTTSGKSGIARDDALNHVADTWRAAAPLTGWLDEHVGPSTLEPRERWQRRPAKPPEPAG